MSTASKRLVELRSSRSVNRDQVRCEKPWKFNVSGVFSCPSLFDLFSRILTKSDRKIVVNTEGTALFGALVVKFWGKIFEMRERKKYVWPHFSPPGPDVKAGLFPFLQALQDKQGGYPLFEIWMYKTIRLIICLRHIRPKFSMRERFLL